MLYESPSLRSSPLPLLPGGSELARLGTRPISTWSQQSPADPTHGRQSAERRRRKENTITGDDDDDDDGVNGLTERNEGYGIGDGGESGNSLTMNNDDDKDDDDC